MLRDLAPKIIGAKQGTEDEDLICRYFDVLSGRRVFITAMKLTARAGVERYEVRMLAQVTAIPVKLPGRRKLKVSLAMLISQGLVGPKAMAKAAVDGHTVNIP